MALQVAQRAAARQVGTVGKHLHRNVVLAADLLKNRAGQAAGGVFLAGIDFDHNTLAQNDLVAGVSLISKIGVNGVGIIGAEHKAVGKCLGLCLGTVGDRIQDAVEHIAQKAAVCALAGAAAHFFVIKHRPDRGASAVGLRGGVQKAVQGGGGALQVVNAGGHEQLAVRPNAGGCLAGVKRKVKVHNVLFFHTGGLSQQGGEGLGTLQPV